MTYAEFVALVLRLRQAQKAYFRGRGQNALAESKVLEQKVDRAIEEQTRQPSLFDGEGEP